MKLQNTRLKANLQASAILLLLLLSSIPIQAQSSEKKTQLNYFGHLENYYEAVPNTDNLYYRIGEQDFFVTSQITERISFLSESVVRYDSKTSSNFIPSIERVQLKYNYFKNHSLVFGKMHTPVNYWNDVYHHGRLFFPTIDRPLSFSYLVPVHTLGLRMQAENLGSLKWGYDFVLGNGISSNDYTDTGINGSMMAGLHFKPVSDLRVGISYYRDLIEGNVSGVHSGHSTSAHTTASGRYHGDIRYELFSLSVSYFSDRFEFLNEGCFNKSGSDTLGIASNFGNYTYLGIKFGKATPFLAYDFIDISDKDVHVGHLSTGKLIVGCRYDINAYLNLKLHGAMISQNHSLVSTHSHTHTNTSGSYECKLQVAYGF